MIEQPKDHASRVLATCGADPITLRGAVDGRVGPITGEPLPDEAPFTQLALNSLQHALREALRANASSIDTIHLALGLITVGKGVAHDVLVTLGVSYERLRAAAEGRTPVPLVPRRNPVDAFDRLRVRAYCERHGLTHHRQRLPVDVVDGVATGVVVRVERDACATAPKPRLHFGFPL